MAGLLVFIIGCILGVGYIDYRLIKMALRENGDRRESIPFLVIGLPYILAMGFAAVKIYIHIELGSGIVGTIGGILIGATVVQLFFRNREFTLVYPWRR